MSANKIQLQVEIRRISSRLSKLESNEKEVVGALEALEDEVYGLPKNKKHRQEVLGDIKRSLEDIKEGRYHTYKSVKELDKAIRSRS